MGILLSILLALAGFAGASFAEPVNYLSADPVTSSRCHVFTFDSTGSYDPDDERVSVEWDFGDGTSSAQPAIEHAYQQSGDYTVKLNISDHSSPDCCISVISQIVRANVAPEAFFAVPEQACTGSPLVFTASSQKNVDSFNAVYDWDFGDGTRSSEAGSVRKIYTQGGDYKITLSVDDQKKSACSVRSFSKNIHVNQPPSAEAGDEVMEQCAASPDESLTVSFNAGKSSDANDDPLTYTWDFGDGAKERGIQITHTYQKPGHYEVKLIVDDQTNSGCNSSVDFIQVRIGVAPEANAGETVTTCAGSDVEFDGSDSYAHTQGTLSAGWDFGDGESAEGLKVKHAYQKSGRYPAVLSVRNLTNQACPESKDTKNVFVNAPPAVVLTVSKAACVGEVVELIANAHDPDSDVLEYYWTFGDGAMLRGGPKVTHEYQQGGQYRVSVIVDDGQKTSCSTGAAETFITINTPPQAHISLPAHIQMKNVLEFNASASSDPDADNLTYRWDFGDGSSAGKAGERGEGPVAAHTYQDRGSYQVKLTVDDNSGTSCSQSTDSTVADVKSAPVAVMSIR